MFLFPAISFPTDAYTPGDADAPLGQPCNLPSAQLGQSSVECCRVGYFPACAIPVSHRECHLIVQSAHRTCTDCLCKAVINITMQSLAGQMPGHLCTGPVQNGFLSCPTHKCGRQHTARQVCSAQRGGQASMAKVSTPTPYKCATTLMLCQIRPITCPVCRRSWTIDSSGIHQMLAGCGSSLAKMKEVNTHLACPLPVQHSNRQFAALRQACSSHLRDPEEYEPSPRVCSGKYSAENWEKGGVATITPLSGSPYVVSTLRISARLLHIIEPLLPRHVWSSVSMGVMECSGLARHP